MAIAAALPLLVVLVSSSTTATSSTTSDAALMASVDIDRLYFRMSLPTEADFEAWEEDGFRMMLGYAHGRIRGWQQAPEGTINTVELQFGARLSPLWSLMASLRYGDAAGARFTGVVEPTLHIVGGLSVSLGLGMSVWLVSGEEITSFPEDEVVATRTFPQDAQVLGACSASGLVAQARLQYLFVLGSSAATGPSLQTELSSVGCEASLERIDLDTGRAIGLRQYFDNYAWSLGWVIAFR